MDPLNDPIYKELAPKVFEDVKNRKNFDPFLQSWEIAKLSAQSGANCQTVTQLFFRFYSLLSQGQFR